MKKLFSLLMFTFALSTPAAFAAVQADQLRGEIVSVDSAAATIRVRITESGDERAASVGSLQNFNIPDDTPIEYVIDSSIYARNRRGNADLSDISEGDSVLLKFEDAQGVRQATNLRNERTTNTAVRERIRREGRIVRNSNENMNSNNTVAAVSTNERSSLPTSASPMPLLALIGMLFAGLATVVRRVRQ